MDWTPDLPKPSSEDWRAAYGFTKDEQNLQYKTSDKVKLSTYQAPNGKPIPFIYDSVKLSGGLSVDTSEFPFFGLWSSTPINEKPQGITVSGYFRGNEYIKNRNALVQAVRVATSDEQPGFLDLPLWGRFPVVVTDWDVEENAKEGGQSKLSLTFVRAGMPLADRWELAGDIGSTIPKSLEALREAGSASFADKLKNNLDTNTLASSLTELKDGLLKLVGRIQAAESTLNSMSNEVVAITNLLAQGVRTPQVLAQAVFSAVAKIATGVLSVKNAALENTNLANMRYFFNPTKNNAKNILLGFLPSDKYTGSATAITVKQSATKTETANLYRIACFFGASTILPELEGQTYDKMQNYWQLYTALENSLDQSNPAVSFAISDLRSAVSRDLVGLMLSRELSVSLDSPMPVLALAHYLGTSNTVLRNLNRISDSFALSGELTYV